MAKHLIVTNAVACEYHEPYNPASCPSKDLAVITGKVLNGPTQKLWARRRWELDAVSKPELAADNFDIRGSWGHREAIWVSCMKALVVGGEYGGANGADDSPTAER